MIQRSLFRASRSLGTRLPNRTISTPLRSPFIRYPAVQPSSTRVASRWYSDATSAKDNGKVNEGTQTDSSTSDASSSAQPTEVETLKKDLEAKNKEIIDLKDKYIRAIADYRNLQERTKREAQAAKDFALQKFARDLIPAVDNLAHALTSVPSERLGDSPSADSTPAGVHSDLVNLFQGLQLSERVLLDTLQKHGLVRFDPSTEAEKFDPNRHEAVFQAPQPEKEDGTVFHTQQKGYSLNGRVLRAAQVGVVKNS